MMTDSGRTRALHLQALSRFVLLLAIPVLIGVIMWVVALQAQKRALWVRHSLQVELALRSLISDVRTAEASQRGFSLTGEPEYRDSYQAAKEASQLEIAQLANLTADNPRQTQTLSQLRPFIEQRFAALASAMEQSSQTGLRKPSIQPGANIPLYSFGSIRVLVNQMLQEEEQLLKTRETELKKTATRFYGALILGYALIVLVVASLYRSAKRYSIRSAQAEARLSALNAELDERIRQRTDLLHAREELLRIFVRYVPAAVAMFDREMHYLQVSDRWCTAYGVEYDRILGQSHYDVFPDIPDRWKAIHQRCLQGETLRAEADRWERDNRVFWMHWEIRPWGEKDGLPEGILIFTEDITARKEIEDALRESEATNRALLETASQAILAVDAEGKIVLANRMVSEIFGYSSNELIGQHHDILIPPALRERHRAHRAAFLADPRPRTMGIEQKLVGMRKDGTVFPIEVSLSAVQTQHGLLAVSFISDVTVRKQAEIKLLESEQKLRELAGRLLTAQDKERSNLARELHDDVTQQLALLSIELGRLVNELPDTMSDARAHLQTLQNQTLRTSQDLRRISHGLHPSVITDFGLSVALEEFCEEFERAHRIRVVFETSFNDAHLSDAEATCLYRIAQESMSNAVMHGHASEVHITLLPVENQIQLRVQDNGIGVSPEKLQSKTGLGIVSMNERIRLVNGTLQLTSEVGRGTLVTASVPLTENRYDESPNSSR